MKFILSIVAYLLMSAVLGWGILLLVRGNPWLFIASFLAYFLAFAKLGCLPKQTH